MKRKPPLDSAPLKTKKARTPCDTCHKKNHLTKNCPVTKTPDSIKKTSDKKPKKACLRCGSTEHSKCPKCSRCKEIGHKASDCKCGLCESTEHTTEQHQNGTLCEACSEQGFPGRFHDSKRGTSTKCVNYKPGLAKVDKGQHIIVITMSLKKFIKPGVTIRGNNPFAVIDWMVATCSEIAVNCKFDLSYSCTLMQSSNNPPQCHCS